MLVDAGRQQIENFRSKIHRLKRILIGRLIQKLDQDCINVFFIIRSLELLDLVDKIEFGSVLFHFKWILRIFYLRLRFHFVLKQLRIIYLIVNFSLGLFFNYFPTLIAHSTWNFEIMFCFRMRIYGWKTQKLSPALANMQAFSNFLFEFLFFEAYWMRIWLIGTFPESLHRNNSKINY